MEGSGTQEEFDFLASGPASTSGRSDAELLKGALMNERASPEVLQFETDLISRIEQNVDYQVRVEGAARAAGGHRRQPSTAAAGAAAAAGNAPAALHAAPRRRSK